jgi:hypothetical protein
MNCKNQTLSYKQGFINIYPLKNIKQIIRIIAPQIIDLQIFTKALELVKKIPLFAPFSLPLFITF